MLKAGSKALLAAAVLLWAATASAQLNASNNAGVDAATSATVAAPPAKAAYIGARESTNLVGLIQCDKTAQATIATAVDTQLVAISGSTVVYVCAIVIEIQGIVTTAGTLQLEYGTGVTCATGKTAITPSFIGSTTAGNPWSVALAAPIGYLFKTTAGQALCALSTTTTTQKVFITFAQF